VSERDARLELEWALIGVHERDLSMLVAHIGGARDYPPLVSPDQGKPA